jgi:tetratricopeptide (TPR) repeat protein
MKLKIIAILAGLFLIGTFFMPGGSSVNVKNIYDEAEKAYAEKKYQVAIEQYNLAIEEGKKFGANTTVIDEDFDSLAKFKIATAYHELGKQLGDATKYEESLKLCPEIYQQTKTAKVKEGIIFLWGVNLYELERYEEAEPKFRELVNDYPDSRFLENAYYTLGRLYYKLKQFESAREAFKSVMTKYPNSEYIDDSQYFIGDCFFQEANYDQSALEFEKVNSKDDSLQAQARYYGSLSLYRMGRNQDALTAYEKFVGDFPSSPFMTGAYFDMGSIHSKLKEYDAATQNYELAIQNAKDDITKGQIQFEIGNNYFTAEDYQMAINAYKKLMETYPSDTNIAEARYYIAESYWWLKDYQNGLQTYTEVLDKEPSGPHAVECMFRIGQCNYQLGNKELALEWYDKIINNYPDSPLVKDTVYEKLWALGDLKRYDEVEKVGREYIEKYKKDPTYDVAAAETQMKLGDIKYDAGNYSSASDEYLLVVSDYSNLPKFDPFKARSLLQSGTAYYTMAENSNWDEAMLRKAADSYEQLLNSYERNFDKEKRAFEGREEYITSAVINLGLAYSTLKEIDKANQTLSMLPKTNPEYGRAVYLRGKALADSGRTDEAMVAYREMVNNKGLSQDWRSRAAIELASNLTKAGRFQEALTEYQNIVTEYPDSEFLSTALYYAGSSYYELEPKTPENMNNAIAFFQQVLDKYSESETGPWAYIGMMAAYEQLGSFDKIIALADQMEAKYANSKIVRIDEALDMARRRKVDSMQKLETVATADALVPELKKIVANPVGDEEGKAAAQMRIGMLLFGEKRYEEAIAEYQVLLDKFPGKYTGAAYYQMAASAFQMDDPAKAIDSARKGLESPDLTQEVKTGLYYTMGLAYGKVQNPAEETTAMEQTVQSAEGATSDNVKQMALAARRGLAKAYADTKQYQEAEKQYIYLSENLATPAEKADSYFWLARLYEDMQQYPKAVETYDKVVQANGSEILSAQSLYFNGVLYTNSVKNDEKALNAFTELVNKYSSTTDSNVKQMITDANIRIPDLLTSLGKFDEALAGARKARETAIASGTKEDKINTQYQVANLLGQAVSKQAEKGKSDPALSKEAAVEFAKVVDLAKPLNDLSDDMKLVAAASLYNTTFLYYNMGGFDNFAQAAKYGEMLIDNFPKNENYQSTLQLMGFTTYEMARLKADLPGFEKAAQLFLRFAKEFPRNKDAGNAQYQAGEAYFTVGGGYTVDKQKAKAADAYRKAISAYRLFVNNYSGNEYAPDAMYAMASCYAYVSDLLSDPREADNMNKVYKELVDKYPKSKYAAVAFEAVGNDFYNKATAPGVTEKTQTDMFKQALSYYRQGLQVPNIESKTRQSLEAYSRETESLLAQKPYSQALLLVPTEGTNPDIKRQNAPKAIPILNNIISTYPNTDVADLSYVQLGLCYESLEQWDNAISAYGKLLKKYTDSKGNPIIPYSDNVVSAVEFAKGRRNSIMSFQSATKAAKQSGR